MARNLRDSLGEILAGSRERDRCGNMACVSRLLSFLGLSRRRGPTLPHGRSCTTIGQYARGPQGAVRGAMPPYSAAIIG